MNESKYPQTELVNKPSTVSRTSESAKTEYPPAPNSAPASQYLAEKLADVIAPHVSEGRK